MDWLLLTLTSGKGVAVNMHLVRSIRDFESHTELHFADGWTLKVKETMKQILERM